MHSSRRQESDWNRNFSEIVESEVKLFEANAVTAELQIQWRTSVFAETSGTAPLCCSL
jgi:hypothetical protein